MCIQNKIELKIEGGKSMIQVFGGAYDMMLGNIDKSMMSNAVACIGQCTGCKCNCRCSCSCANIAISSFEWEEV